MRAGFITHSTFFVLPDDPEGIAAAVRLIPSDWERLEGILSNGKAPNTIRLAELNSDVREHAASAVQRGYRGLVRAFHSSARESPYQNPVRCWYEFPWVSESSHEPRYLKVDRDDQSTSIAVYERFVAACRALSLREFTPTFAPPSPGTYPVFLEA